MEISKQDWKTYREKMPGWQERYMEKLNKEYIEILSKDDAPARKFWQLEKRIRDDKKSIGVVVKYRRSQMKWQLLELLNDNIISKEELSCFSKELQEEIEFTQQSWV